ncbi:MAG: amidohydrolase [Acidimicrobiia bacterium]|nr:amidohydrolase [Acidimicrobiia bacterium]
MPPRLIVTGSVRDHTGRRGDAVLVDGGRVAAVGRSGDLRSAGVAEVHLPATVLVPGLRDAHLHPVGLASLLQRPSLKPAADFAGIADILRDAARSLAPGVALTALRLDDESLAEGALPDRDFIDRVVSDRPALLIRYCGHVAVANSAALALAGIDAGTADPRGGSIDRDASGRPTGVVRETAVEPVAGALRALSPPVTADDLIATATGLASVGLTGVGAMVAADSGQWGCDGAELDVVLDAASHLPITFGVMVIAADPTELEVAAARLAATAGRVRFTGVKMFSDGSLGGHTAAMHEGFSDAPQERGTDRLDPAWCLSMARTSLRLGGRVAIHAIGDRANASVLDVMETLLAEGADPGLLRIEHASVLTPGDISRFGRLGITASVQPAFLASETGWLEKRVGPDRLRRTYPLRSLLAAGTPLAGGSDCPVEPPYPLWGMAAARDRCGLVPDEGLTAEQALHLFTEGAATAIGEDATLRPGAAASFTILDADPVEASPEELRTMSVRQVWVEGERVGIPEGTVVWKE